VEELTMSNGTFVWTPEQTAAGFAQFSKAMELVREGHRRPEIVSRALQVVIGDEDIITAPKMITTPTGKIFHVTGNFRTAEEAIASTDCKVKWGLAETPAKIPMIIQPVDCKVRAIELGKTMTTEEIYKTFPNIISPAEALAFGAKFQQEQTEAPHFTVWLDAAGRFFYVVLGVGSDERSVNVDGDDPGGQWGGRCRVLVRE
jgi:hypothetical protein